MRKSYIASLFWLLIAGLTAISCRDNSPPAGAATDTATNTPQIFFVKGVVEEIKPNGKTVIIAHEEIPNYMPAMTMPFEVKNSKELQGITTNDAVFFRMLVTEDDAWIDRVSKTGSAAAAPKTAGPRRVRIVEPLNLGDPIPDYPFTNELGQAVSLGQFKGKAVAITFIFTRCPYPLFCPRMASNFSETYQQLRSRPDAPKNWQLLSISFDPEFDTPEVLKQYAQRYDYDPQHWSFLTGKLIDIDALTEQFGLVFPRSSGIGFDHNLRTVVLDAQGRVHHVFVGNEWKSSELTAKMVEAAAVQPKSQAERGNP